jgi:hypothetical protein
MYKKRNLSQREKNSAATDNENHLLQKIIPLSLNPLQQRIRFLGVARHKNFAGKYFYPTKMITHL